MTFQPPSINEHVAARFEAARREIEAWRQSRTSRSRIPENLWILATDLARECGVFQTARELRLNYGALRNRIGPKGPRIGRSKQVPAPMGFVEVVPSPAAGFSECTVEIERGKGTKIKIHLKSREAPDLGAIGNAFLRARP